jgi:hypothetical protein
MNVLALTVYSRADLLKIYFNQLLKDKEELGKYLVHFFLDYGFNPECLKVIHEFRKEHKNIAITLRTQEDQNKSPLPGFYNIAQSYLIAEKETDEFVVLGEEDIIPTDDYLRFNRYVYENFLSKQDCLFCVAHKRRPETEKKGDISILIGDYQITSPSCVSKEAIIKYMKPHLDNPLFYKNPIEYNKYYFSKSRIPPEEHIHHDGMIERIAESNNLLSLKPDQARSMHVGVGGMHGGTAKEITGTLQERVAKYYELFKNPEELRTYAERFKEDIVVTDLDNEEWNELYLDIDRTRAKSSSWWYDPDNDFKKRIK